MEFVEIAVITRESTDSASINDDIYSADYSRTNIPCKVFSTPNNPLHIGRYVGGYTPCQIIRRVYSFANNLASIFGEIYHAGFTYDYSHLRIVVL
jgi:hypothetical protein